MRITATCLVVGLALAAAACTATSPESSGPSVSVAQSQPQAPQRSAPRPPPGPVGSLAQGRPPFCEVARMCRGRGVTPPQWEACVRQYYPLAQAGSGNMC